LILENQKEQNNVSTNSENWKMKNKLNETRIFPTHRIATKKPSNQG